MRKRIFGIIGVLLFTGFISMNCNSNSNPAAAATSTPAIAGTSTASPTATLTPTATRTPDSGNKLYTFNSTTDGWTAVSGGITSTARNTSPSYVSAGAGSLALGCAFGAPNTTWIGSVSLGLYSTPVDLRGKTIYVFFYTPSDLAALSPDYEIQVRAIDALGSGWKTITGTTLGTAGWRLLSFSVPSTADYSYINYIGFQIQKGSGYTSPDWTGTVYIDEVSW